MASIADRLLEETGRLVKQKQQQSLIDTASFGGLERTAPGIRTVEIQKKKGQMSRPKKGLIMKSD